MKTALLAVILFGLTNTAFAQAESDPLLALAPPKVPEPQPLGSGELPAPGFHVESKVRPAFVVGLGLAALGYLGAATFATALAIDEIQHGGSPEATTYLFYVPLVGPGISQLSFKSCQRCSIAFTNLQPHRFLVMAFSTSLQLTGLVLALVGGLARIPIAVPDGLSLEAGAAGAPLGMTLVFRN